MCRFASKRNEAEKWLHPVGKRVLAIIEKQKQVARYCQSTFAGNAKFQVTFLGTETFVVTYGLGFACRSFELSGIIVLMH